MLLGSTAGRQAAICALHCRQSLRRNLVPASIPSLSVNVTVASFSIEAGTDRKKRVVILGSGWGGFNVAKNLSKKRDRVDVTLISPANHFLFTPLLPSTAVGTLEFRAIQEPIRTLPGVHYLQAKARKIDTEAKQLTCQDIFVDKMFKVDYDELVVCVGTKTNTFGTKGVLENEGEEVFFLKHLYHARLIRNRILECFERADIPQISDEEKNRLLQFIVVGGGPTSCEFAAELHDFISNDIAKWYPDLQSRVKISLIEANDHLLGPFDSSLRDYVKSKFKQRNIDVRTGQLVTAVEKRDHAEDDGHDTVAVLSNGAKIPFGTMVWSAGLASVKFTNGAPFPVGNTGRILIDKQCRIPDFPSCWAIGDCAVNESEPMPQLAQVAAQQADFVSDAILNSVEGKPHDKEFRLFLLGSLASLGFGDGVVDFTHVGQPGKQKNLGTIRGIFAHLMYRGAYLGKAISWSNRMLIPMFWFKSFAFGRDISRF